MISAEKEKEKKKDVWVAKSGQLQSVTGEGEMCLQQKMHKGSKLPAELGKD